MPSTDVPPTVFQTIASTIIAFITFALVFLVIYLSFNWIAFIGATGLFVLIMVANPRIVKNIIENSSIQYYCILFVMTLLFSISICSNNNTFIILVIVEILATLLSFYTGTPLMIMITIWMHLYVVLLFLVTYWDHSGSFLGLSTMSKNAIVEK